MILLDHVTLFGPGTETLVSVEPDRQRLLGSRLALTRKQLDAEAAPLARRNEIAAILDRRDRMKPNRQTHRRQRGSGSCVVLTARFRRM